MWGCRVHAPPREEPVMAPEGSERTKRQRLLWKEMAAWGIMFFHHMVFCVIYRRHRGGSSRGQLPCQNSFLEKDVGGFAFPQRLPFSPSKTDCGSSSCFPDPQVENPVPGWSCLGDSVLLLHQEQFWNLKRDVLFYPKVPFSLSMSEPTKAELRTLITELVLFSLM